MMNILKWVKQKTSEKIDNVWCIRCCQKRTVIRQRVVETPNPKQPKLLSRRMIGECTICEATTSTFV